MLKLIVLVVCIADLGMLHCSILPLEIKAILVVHGNIYGSLAGVFLLQHAHSLGSSWSHDIYKQ